MQPREEKVFKKLSEEIGNIKEVQRIFLIYGASGTGKTTLASYFPKPLFLSCEPGVLGGALSAVKNDPLFVKIDTYKQLMDILPKLKEYAKKEFETIVVDSMSYLSRIVMNSILQTINKEIPRFEEWNLSAERIRRIINYITDIGVNVVFTAVDSITKDEICGKIFGAPDLPGKLAKELPQACDIVLRLFVTSSYTSDGKKKVNYMYQTTPDDIWFARDRTNLLPAEGFISKENPFQDFECLFK